MPGQPRGAVPQRVDERGQEVGLYQERSALSGHSGCEQDDQPAGDREEPVGRDPQQAEVHQCAGGDTRREPEHRAREQGAGVGAAGGDAIQEQDHLGSFAKHCEPDHQRQQVQRDGRRSARPRQRL